MSNWWDRNKHRYPDDWEERVIKLKEAAGWKCEACRNPHGAPPYILTTDHLNHDPENPDAVLLILCQRCHLRRQGMRPRPTTKAEAIERLRRRYEHEQGQLRLELAASS